MAKKTEYDTIELTSKGIIVLGVGYDAVNDVYRVVAVDGDGKLKVEDS